MRPYTQGMSTKPKRPRDPNQLAKLIADMAVGEVERESVSDLTATRASAGRKGGLRGGKSRMAGLSEDERIKLAQKAASARWGNEGAPDKAGAPVKGSVKRER